MLVYLYPPFVGDIIASDPTQPTTSHLHMFGNSKVNFPLSYGLAKRILHAIRATKNLEGICGEICQLLFQGMQPSIRDAKGTNGDVGQRRDDGDVDQSDDDEDYTDPEECISHHGRFSRRLHRRINKFLDENASSLETERGPAKKGIDALVALNEAYLKHLEAFAEPETSGGKPSWGSRVSKGTSALVTRFVSLEV